MKSDYVQKPDWSCDVVKGVAFQLFIPLACKTLPTEQKWMGMVHAFEEVTVWYRAQTFKQSHRLWNVHRFGGAGG